MSPDAYVPMPGTCHPHYEPSADGIRTHLHQPAVVVAEPMQLSASFFNPEDDKIVMSASTTTRVLKVSKVAGPAPYVGDPQWDHRVYFWRVAIDNLGRHVAGEAELSERSYRYE